jgi:gamma-glutamyl-gamma-aminobutyrate hydrolase PuuD
VSRRLFSAYYDEKDPFDGLFAGNYKCGVDADELEKNDVLILWGGEDISPRIYHEKPAVHRGKSFTGAPPSPSRRDRIEQAFAKRAIELGVPMIGVCRGAQLMCSIAGGSLWQHVTGHNSGNHEITTYDGKKLLTNSIHHQMMRLENTNHKLLAWTTTPRSKVYVNEASDENVSDIEPEIAYFPLIKTLAIQGHPEYASPTSEFVQYCRGLVKEFIL